MVLVAYARPVRSAAALRDSVLCLSTDIHLSLVNKPSPPTPPQHAPCSPRGGQRTHPYLPCTMVRESQLASNSKAFGCKSNGIRLWGLIRLETTDGCLCAANFTAIATGTTLGTHSRVQPASDAVRHTCY